MESPSIAARDPAPAASAPPAATLGAAAQKAGDRMIAAARESGVEIEKIVVAVHGIGDQYRQATIQSVVTRFGYHFDFPATIPLGSFYSSSGDVSAFTLKAVPPNRAGLAGVGFLEAYWADIPRGVQQQGYTIQESKAWARTIVERIRARYGETASNKFGFHREDFQSASMVLDEMVSTIAVLGNLLFLAEKAGILKFDLDTMLTSYLGDVQIVADFANYRAKILAQFDDVLSKVYQSVRSQQQTDPEIYVVAHSEGTVVAFMALLQAMSVPLASRPAWIERVRGLMTIGSPIDKHLILFPDIWDALQTPFKAPAAGAIRWRNYYDYGDPVGFELDTARTWLREHGWEKLGAFEFRNTNKKRGIEDDIGFGRYFLPGAAHNDYWTDPGVFGHFIKNIIGLPAHTGVKGDFSHPPRSNPVAYLVSYVLPYFLAWGTLYLGVYLIYRALGEFLADKSFSRAVTQDCLAVIWWRDHYGYPVKAANGLLDVILNTTGITCLLSAITLGARIPRLTRKWYWLLIAAGLFGGFATLYVCLVDVPRHSWLGFYEVNAKTGVEETVGPMRRTLLLAAGITLLAAWSGRVVWRREWLRWLLHGMRPLLIPGVLAVGVIVIFRLFHMKEPVNQSLWPLLLAGAAFVYLWWLAALLFDLVFVWHRYIRWGTVNARLGKWRARHKETEQKRASEHPSATAAGD